MSKPDAWGVTKGSEVLKQHAEATTEEELNDVREMAARNGHVVNEGQR